MHLTRLFTGNLLRAQHAKSNLELRRQVGLTMQVANEPKAFVADLGYRHIHIACSPRRRGSVRLMGNTADLDIGELYRGGSVWSGSGQWLSAITCWVASG